MKLRLTKLTNQTVARTQGMLLWLTEAPHFSNCIFIVTINFRASHSLEISSVSFLSFSVQSIRNARLSIDYDRKLFENEKEL